MVYRGKERMRVEDDDSDTILHNTQDAGLESHNSTTIEPTLAQGQTNPLHMQGVTPQISDPIGIMNLQPRRPDPCSAPYVEVSAIKLPCGPTDNPYMVRLTYVTAVEGTYCREPTAWISFRLPRRYVETCCYGSSIQMTDAQGGREKYAWIFARPTITDRQLDNRFVGNCNGEVYALALHPRQHGPYKRLWFVDVAEDWANDVDFFRLMQRGVSIMK